MPSQGSTRSGWQRCAGRRSREILAVLAALLPWSLPGCGPPRPERVVLVSIDTLRADYLGCYGGKLGPTPVLDAVAAGGTRFATAMAPTPLTLPSHATLLTGLDPPRHGVRNNAAFRLDASFTTLAERLREEGYATAAFVGAVVLDRQYGLAAGFDVYDDQMSSRRHTRHGLAERTADQVVGSALAWLEDAPDRFFLFLHLYDPHADYRPPDGFRAAAPFSAYAGEIAFADYHVGRLLEAVEARFRDERTLVVVTSDHGESLGEHGEWTHALTVYDATQRIPLLMRGAGIPAGRVVEDLVRLADVAPTILERVGAAPLPETSGRSLVPLLEGGTLEPRPAYLETLSTQLDFGWSPLLAIRTAGHKYVRAPRPELYALARDPGEVDDVAARHPELVAELDAALAELLVGALPVRPSVEPTEEQRARLESLGYVVTAPGEAPPELGRVGGRDPKDGLADVQSLLSALALLRQGRAEEALRKLERLDVRGFVASLMVAEVAMDAGAWRLAESHVRRAIELRPSDSTAHRLLGVVLEESGRPAAARVAYERAAALDPAAGEPLLGLGRLAEAKGDREAARDRYRRAADSRTAPAEAFWRLAALHLESGDEAAASELLARIPAEALRDPDAALRLAAAEHRGGRAEAARGRLRAALSRRPEDPELARALADLEGGGG